MAKAEKLSADFVRSILDYDLISGEFRWRYRSDVGAWWNGRYAGKRLSTLDSKGYLKITINEACYRGHRIAWLIVTGEWPDVEVDHFDLDRTNNRWENLRRASSSDNKKNTRAKRNNLSGLKGVSRYLHYDLWAARIRIDGRNTHLGYFKSPEAAHDAYRKAAEKHFGEFARAA